jgi:hypothetical protein
VNDSDSVFISGHDYSAVPWWLLDAGASYRAVYVWCLLYRMAFESRNRYVGMTHAQLAAATGEGTSSVRRGVQELQDLGGIVIHPVLENGFQSGNRYEVLFGGRGVPVEEGGTCGGHAGVPPGDSNSIPKEPKKTPPTAESEYSEEFEILWKAYPKTIGKKAAHAKYLATLKRGNDHPPLLSATLAYAKKMEGTEERYVKNGATFFGPQEPWRDFAKTRRAAPTGEVLERSLIWNAYFTDPDHLVEYPSVIDPRISPEGRPYRSEPRGPYLIQIWLDEI